MEEEATYAGRNSQKRQRPVQFTAQINHSADFSEFLPARIAAISTDADSKVAAAAAAAAAGSREELEATLSSKEVDLQRFKDEVAKLQASEAALQKQVTGSVAFMDELLK